MYSGLIITRPSPIKYISSSCPGIISPSRVIYSAGKENIIAKFVGLKAE